MNHGTETLLAVCYVGFLLAVAGLLEVVARHVHRRSQQSITAGFVYRRNLDVWECPDGRNLYREETETPFKVIRYRAEAQHCNRCVFKFRCTDSDSGRVIEHRPSSWLDSGLYRFHRGMSLALLLLAGMILCIEMVRTRSPRAEIVLTVFMVGIGSLCIRLLRTLRAAA